MSGRLRPELPEEATELDGPPGSTGDSPRNRTAATIRELVDLLVGRDLPDDALVHEAEVLRGVVDRLEEAASPGKRVRTSPDISTHPQDFFPFSPLAGFANPLSLPLELWRARDEDGREFIRGRAIFPVAFEGPPTCVHGGIIALLFDEVLGDANLIAGTPGMTGTLNVRYRRPTPLMTPLDIEARQVGIDGRKITTLATISVDGEVTAEAEAIFISVPPEQMLTMAAANARNASGDVVDPQLQRAIEENEIST
jgi:hypothetical protein